MRPLFGKTQFQLYNAGCIETQIYKIYKLTKYLEIKRVWWMSEWMNGVFIHFFATVLCFSNRFISKSRAGSQIQQKLFCIPLPSPKEQCIHHFSGTCILWEAGLTSCKQHLILELERGLFPATLSELQKLAMINKVFTCSCTWPSTISRVIS